MSKTQTPLPVRIARLHNVFQHMGRLGFFGTKCLAFYSLYATFSNGGIEPLAVLCHKEMLNQAQKLKLLEEKTHGNHPTPST